MRKALRPYLTAGVAVVGAGALAIAPVIATPPDVRIVNPAVQQSDDPLATYVDTVREALENLEALLGSALALPSPTAWTLDLALTTLMNDPGADVPLFIDHLESLGPLAGASVPGLLEGAGGAVDVAIDQAALSNIDPAIINLIRMYTSLAPVVAAVVTAPLTLIGSDLADEAGVVLAKSLTAAAGPVLSGIGTTAVAIRSIVDALDNAEPGSGAVLAAMIAAPATVVDGVLNGFAPAAGSTTLPGLLTPGDLFDPTKPDPGPVALAVGLVRGLSASSPAQSAATGSDTGPQSNRVMTLDVDAGQATTRTQHDDGRGETETPDAATNVTVLTGAGGSGAPTTYQGRPGLPGGGATMRNNPGAGLAALRHSVRDGLRDVRDGIRDAVKAVVGRTHDRTAAAGDTDESPRAPEK